MMVTVSKVYSIQSLCWDQLPIFWARYLFHVGSELDLDIPSGSANIIALILDPLQWHSGMPNLGARVASLVASVQALRRKRDQVKLKQKLHGKGITPDKLSAS